MSLHSWLEDFWKAPDFSSVLEERARRLEFLRQEPARIEAARAFYKNGHYAEFICDWGMMRDPRLVAEGRSPLIPFVLFPRQLEMLDWFYSLVQAPARGQSGRGNVEKTRDCGFSWCAGAFACWWFIFHKSVDIGFGSNLERNVYDLGNPKSIFFKIQNFLDLLPAEFQPEGWDGKKHVQKGSGSGKIQNPENGSTITGDCGDDIGRGGRTLLYFVDEHAFIDRPALAEAALSMNTRTQINGSTHNGPGTLFFRQCAVLRREAPERLFEFDWRQDPRKNEEWYERTKNDPTTDLVIFAQEVERNPSLSIADGFLPTQLVAEAQKRPPESCFPSGPYIISVDVAHKGNDSSVIAVRRGSVVEPLLKFRQVETWQLAGEVQRLCKKLLQRMDGPLGAIIYELAGPGYGFHSDMQPSPFKQLLRPKFPQAQLSSLEFFNERARWWGLFKEWLEEGNKSLPQDRNLLELGCALRYSFKRTGKGANVLILESKDEFKARMAADPRNKAAGPSPDEADAVAMGFAPVRLEKFTLSDLAKIQDFFAPRKPSNQWSNLDARTGY